MGSSSSGWDTPRHEVVDASGHSPWPELQTVHDRFSRDYNQQPHFAHRERSDGRHSSAVVLGWMQGAWRDPADLVRPFRLRATRRLKAGDYVRFRDWRLYGERGLAGAPLAV